MDSQAFWPSSPQYSMPAQLIIVVLCCSVCVGTIVQKIMEAQSIFWYQCSMQTRRAFWKVGIIVSLTHTHTHTMFPSHMYIMYLYVHTVYTPTLALEHAHTQFPSLTHILSLSPYLPPSLPPVSGVMYAACAASNSQQRMCSNKKLLRELKRLKEHTLIKYDTCGMNVPEAVT